MMRTTIPISPRNSNFKTKKVEEGIHLFGKTRFAKILHCLENAFTKCNLVWKNNETYDVDHNSCELDELYYIDFILGEITS
jgi:hypothetical protein